MGCILALSETIFRLDLAHERNLVLKTLFTTGSVITQQIQQNMDNGIFTTDILHVFLSTSEFNPDQFNTWGENIMRTNPNVSAVQLAPGGVVQYIYPLAGNEGAMGHDLLKDHRRDDGALRTIENKSLTIVGPIRLIQNNRMAVIARKPVFRQISGREAFWGFTIVLIYIEDLLPESLFSLEKQGILYQVVGQNPDAKIAPVFISSKTVSDHWDYTLPIKIPNGMWQLKLYSQKLMLDYFFSYRLIGVAVALILGFLFFWQQKKNQERSLNIENLNTDLIQATRELIIEKEKLQKAFEEIKTLKGIVPICANCKKIRDDKGYWNMLETYLESHSEARFSHGMCPECNEKLYGKEGWYIDMKKKKT